MQKEQLLQTSTTWLYLRMMCGVLQYILVSMCACNSKQTSHMEEILPSLHAIHNKDRQKSSFIAKMEQYQLLNSQLLHQLDTTRLSSIGLVEARTHLTYRYTMSKILVLILNSTTLSIQDVAELHHQKAAIGLLAQTRHAQIPRLSLLETSTSKTGFILT